MSTPALTICPDLKSFATTEVISWSTAVSQTCCSESCLYLGLLKRTNLRISCYQTK